IGRVYYQISPLPSNQLGKSNRLKTPAKIALLRRWISAGFRPGFGESGAAPQRIPSWGPRRATCFPMTKRIAIYARCSTADDQTTENQISELRAAAERHGWIVVAVFDDQGVSGSLAREPAGDEGAAARRHAARGRHGGGL